MVSSRLWNVANSIYEENNRVYLKQFEPLTDALLLDLGCHDGKLALQVSEKINTNSIYAVEIDPENALKAKDKGLQVSQCDLNQKLPYSDQMFDVISANQILEHLWNTDNFFKEVYRLLKPNGYAVVSTPNLSSFHSLFFMLLGQQTPVVHLIDIQVGNFMRGTYVGSPHYKAFNIPALKDLAKHYGFQVEQTCAVGYYLWPLIIQRGLSRILPRYAIYITIKIRKNKPL
jgi:methionine biosynthesis protein MetW